MRKWKALVIAMAVFLSRASGCASFNPRPAEEVGFEHRAQSFLAKVPDLRTDYEGTGDQGPRWMTVYKQEEIQNLDEAAFRAWVEALPCCVLGRRSQNSG